jgi:hypothetical protein
MSAQPQELATLKELLSIFTNTEATVSRYKRYQCTAGAIALGLILLALIGGSSEFIGAKEAIFAALFGGMAAGLSFLYRCSVQQIPFYTRFTSLDTQSIRERIRQLEDLQGR